MAGVQGTRGCAERSWLFDTRRKSECLPPGAIIFDNQHGGICCLVLVAATSRTWLLHNIEFRSLSDIPRSKKIT